MKIGMMSAWNETSGVSTHAELVGKEWVKQGHDLKVFSFLEDDHHGRALIGEDEDYVTRCFGTFKRTNYLNPIPFLKGDYEYFVVQDLNMLPRIKLSSIFQEIKRKSKTIHVVHENRLSEDPSFYEHDWDRLVCFDERFKNFLSEVYPTGKIVQIPFPCSSWVEGNKEEARKQLGLPLDKKIVFLFGQKWRHLKTEEIQVLRKLSLKIPLLVLIISETQRVPHAGLSGLSCRVKLEELERRDLFRYLHASDTWLFPKKPVDNFAVLSSTIHLAMGSGCVPVARDSNFLYGVKETVLSYSDESEFEQKLMEAFRQGEEWKRARAAAKKFTEKYEGGKIAKMYTDLFESLRS